MNNRKNENIESILYMLKPLIVIENWFGKFRYRMEKGQLTVLNRRMKIYGIFITIILIVPYYATFIDFLLKKQFTEIGEVIDLVDELIDFERHFEVFAFCVFIEILNDKLGVVNINLKQYVRPNNRNMYVNVIIPKNNDIRKDLTNREGNSKLLFLGKAYTIISETNELINKVFQFHIFKCLLSTFIYVIIIIWTFLYYIRSSNAFDTMPRVFMLCVFEILSISAMSFVCELMLLKCRRTKILINDIIMNYDLPVELRIEAKLLMDLTEVRPLKIFAYDMFAIDIKLVLKFVSVSTTYLIVIVQLSHLY
ncbi:uncharacterized protein LOC123658249 [Melitaea cinxia]|uniref:uncharacterized protein LOC123658249 n=1 Tax=Melitaea cinxia TaxID=113334 RepID=UPI001E27269F|nr:uncharacterized protein LOC123658249 [Melitaea cinxia]